MLNSIQSTANYRQNSQPNFGNLSRGITETLILATKREDGYCTLNQVRALAEVARDSLFHTAKDVTADWEKAVSAYDSKKGHFTLPTQPMARRNRINLFEAAKKVILGMTTGGEKKLAEIEAALNKTPQNRETLEQEIREFALNLPDKW